MSILTHVVTTAAAVPVLASAVLLVGAAGVGPGKSTAEAADLKCEVQLRRTGDGVALEARVASSEPVQGTYRLRVSRTGGGGSAFIDQSGPFRSTPGAWSPLGEVTLGGGGGYQAHLVVTADGRRSECRQGGGSL